jgi:hypothetical protein
MLVSPFLGGEGLLKYPVWWYEVCTDGEAGSYIERDVGSSIERQVGSSVQMDTGSSDDLCESLHGSQDTGYPGLSMKSEMGISEQGGQGLGGWNADDEVL